MRLALQKFSVLCCPTNFDTVYLGSPNGGHAAEMNDFLLRLPLAKARRAIAKNVKCSCCDCSTANVAGESFGLVVTSPPLDIKCTQCKSYSCQPWRVRPRGRRADAAKSQWEIRKANNYLFFHREVDSVLFPSFMESVLL